MSRRRRHAVQIYELVTLHVYESCHTYESRRISHATGKIESCHTRGVTHGVSHMGCHTWGRVWKVAACCVTL